MGWCDQCEIISHCVQLLSSHFLWEMAFAPIFSSKLLLLSDFQFAIPNGQTLSLLHEPSSDLFAPETLCSLGYQGTKLTFSVFYFADLVNLLPWYLLISPSSKCWCVSGLTVPESTSLSSLNSFPWSSHRVYWL